MDCQKLNPDTNSSRGKKDYQPYIQDYCLFKAKRKNKTKTVQGEEDKELDNVEIFHTHEKLIQKHPVQNYFEMKTNKSAPEFIFTSITLLHLKNF